MYRKRIGRSSRGNKLIAIDKLMTKILRLTRGNRCEICGRQADNLGGAHILPKSIYPRLRYHEENLLLMCYLPCHFNLHHYSDNDPPNKRTIAKIKELRGEDYREKLLILNKIQPQMTAFQLDLIHKALKNELKLLGARCRNS
jgi:hypothetical protein